MEPCFTALGFANRPATIEDIKTQYRRLAKVMHPDSGGSKEEFTALTKNYNACLRAMKV